MKKQAITPRIRRQVIEEMLATFATRRYIDAGGDKGTFATRKELRMIHEDPVAFLRCLAGYDAADMVLACYNRTGVTR